MKATAFCILCGFLVILSGKNGCDSFRRQPTDGSFSASATGRIEREEATIVRAVLEPIDISGRLLCGRQRASLRQHGRSEASI